MLADFKLLPPPTDNYAVRGR